MITAIYPGTFDPITNGHSDIAIRATKLFERVVLAVAQTSNKTTIFSLEERIELAKLALAEYPNIEVIGFDSLVADAAREIEASVIIRGLRMVSDFDYEFQMAGMNRRLCPEAETVFLTPAEDLSFISSSLIRQISSLNGDVSSFVCEPVLHALKERLGKE